MFSVVSIHSFLIEDRGMKLLSKPSMFIYQRMQPDSTGIRSQPRGPQPPRIPATASPRPLIPAKPFLVPEMAFRPSPGSTNSLGTHRTCPSSPSVQTNEKQRSNENRNQKGHQCVCCASISARSSVFQGGFNLIPTSVDGELGQMPMEPWASRLR